MLRTVTRLFIENQFFPIDFYFILSLSGWHGRASPHGFGHQLVGQLFCSHSIGTSRSRRAKGRLFFGSICLIYCVPSLTFNLLFSSICQAILVRFGLGVYISCTLSLFASSLIKIGRDRNSRVFTVLDSHLLFLRRSKLVDVERHSTSFVLQVVEMFFHFSRV